MSEETKGNKTIKNVGKQLFGILISLGIGAVMGLLCIFVMGPQYMKGIGFVEFMVRFFGIFLILFVWFCLHIVLHEGGHLIGGLLSGYKYGYFRVGRFTFAKYEDGLKLKIFSIPGTGGQCGMVPPAYNNGDFPYKLYLLGGFTMNFITALVLFIVFALLGLDSFVGRIFAMGGAVALYLGIVNALSLKSDLPNDGYQLLQAGKDERERRMLWETLDMQAKSQQGVRISEIERDWEEKSAEELLAQCEGAKGLTEFVLYYNYVFDSGRFEEAEDMATKLLDKGITVALYRKIFEGEALFLELFLHGREERIKELATEELIGFLKSTASSMLSSTRTMYAYEKLYHKDEKEIAKVTKQCANVVKNYPMLGELKQEQELVRRVDELVRERQLQEA